MNAPKSNSSATDGSNEASASDVHLSADPVPEGKQRREEMNMMPAIAQPVTKPPHADRSRRLSGRKCFIDDRGRPSERSGPDLRKAAPIEEVITRLRRCRNAFALEFWHACNASGIDLSIIIWKNGEEDLRMGFPMDCQAALRKPRGDALAKLLNSTDRRREQVMKLVYMLGRFADNQPFESVEEAAEKLLAAGGRIWIWPDGQLEHVVPITSRTAMEESWSGYPRRRLGQRLEATLRQKGAKEAMVALIREKGVLHEGSGTTILSAPDREKEKSE